MPTNLFPTTYYMAHLCSTKEQQSLPQCKCSSLQCCSAALYKVAQSVAFRAPEHRLAYSTTTESMLTTIKERMASEEQSQQLLDTMSVSELAALAEMLTAKAQQQSQQLLNQSVYLVFGAKSPEDNNNRTIWLMSTGNYNESTRGKIMCRLYEFKCTSKGIYPKEPLMRDTNVKMLHADETVRLHCALWLNKCILTTADDSVNVMFNSLADAFDAPCTSSGAWLAKWLQQPEVARILAFDLGLQDPKLADAIVRAMFLHGNAPRADGQRISALAPLVHACFRRSARAV
ncbi:hypothetical protein DFH11DRAFT_1613591 [Phellopilus nigrolimitatus]|nr:hypothetical protein DFH11DRAFT_1613591 [Phellopilus nigrolimitatus]